MAKQISDRTLERMAKLLLLAVILAALAATAYYVNDRYRQPNVPLADRQIEQLEATVRRDPDNIGARVAVGNAYLDQNNYDQAIYQYDEALRLSKDKDEAALLGLGTAYKLKGDNAKAIEYFDRIVALNQGRDTAVANRLLELAYYQLGRIYLDQRQFDLAAERLTKAVAIDRADADAFYLLGNALQAKGDQREAIKAYRSAVSFVPDFVESYQGMAQSYQSLGDRVRIGYPQAMIAFYGGDKRGALRQLEATAAQVTDDAEIYWALGMAREDAGQKAQAADAYARALLLNPNQGLAQAALRRLNGK